MGGSSGISLINHLKRHDFRVIAVDANPYAVGLLHADISYVVPECTCSNYVDVIKSICEKEQVSFVVPLIDEELKLIKGLENNFLKVICPSINFIDASLNKYNLIKSLSYFLQYLPKTFLFSDDFSSLGFPFIIKPKFGRGSKGLYIIQNKDELEKFKLINQGDLDSYIVQEKIEGDEYTVSVIANPNNELLSVVPKKIIEKKGITNIAVTDFNEEINKLCEEITYNLKPNNPYNAQLILDNKTQQPYIFEINPRFSTTITLTIAAGIDEIMAPIEFYLQTKYLQKLKDKDNFKNNLVLVRSIHEEYMEISEYSKKKAKITYAKTN